MRAIKKIVALATGATMLGATVMGAMAATLADYPKPLFIVDGKFAGSIVVGDQAAAEDVVGAIDIATSLQYSATSSTGTGGVTTIIATGEHAKVETNSKKLTLGSNNNNLSGDVKTVPFDKDDLKTILADGTYRTHDSKDFNFKQTIEFDNTVEFKHYADSDFKDKEPNLMVYSLRRTKFMYYTFDFVKAAESTNTSGTLDDYEDSSITMLGKKYDITNADISGTKVTLDLMGGAIKDTLEQGETKTYTLNGKDYEVTVTYIGSISAVSNVKFQVNDETTDVLTKSGIFKLADGTEISVKEILEEEAGEVTADAVEFYLGAEKLTIVDPDYVTTGYGNSSSENVKISDTDIDDLYGDITATWVTDKLKIDKIVLTWKPDSEVFVATNSEVTFPGLGSFKVSYQGYSTGTTEEIKIEPHGNNVIEMTVPLETGTVTFDLLNGTGVNFTSVGGESYRLGTCDDASNSIVSFDLDSMDYFVASNLNGRESYLLKVTTLHNTSSRSDITIKDQASGTYYRDLTAGAHTIGAVTLTISTIDAVNNKVTIANGDTTYGCGYLFTKNGLTITMPRMGTTDSAFAWPEVGDGGNNRSATYNLLFWEEDKDENIVNVNGVKFNVQLGWSSDKAEVKDIPVGNFSGSNLFEIGTTEEYVGHIASDLGTKVSWDKHPTQNTAKLTYNDVQSYANVYVSEVTTTFASQEGAAATTIEKIEVGTAKLASEIANVKAQNLLLVGGPCANKAASEVMGFTAFPDPECAKDFTEGKAKIKLYDTGAGKIAMLVAGYNAADTRRAAKVTAEYDTYKAKLTGTEVEVTGTSMTDITVTSVQ